MKKFFGLLITLIFLGLLYFAGMTFFRTHFLPRTKINDVSVAFRSVDTASERISSAPVIIKLKEKAKDGSEAEETITLEPEANTSFRYDCSEILAQQDPKMWLPSFFKEKTYTCNKIYGSYDLAALKRSVHALNCLNSANVETPKDAYLALEGQELFLREATAGNLLKEDVLTEAVKTFASAYLNGSGEDTLDLSPYYEKAAIQADDPALQQQYQDMQDLLGKTVQLNISASLHQDLRKDVFFDWLLFADNAFTVNEEKVQEYARSIADKYSVSDYEYISSSGLTKRLSEAVLATEDTLVDAPWVYESRKKVEVSISQQTLWYYENDEVVFSSPIVSGDVPTGCSTPTGTYYVQRKVSPNTLRGSDYTEYVDYWIGWDNAGGHLLGFHDASWRSEFGGDIYLTDGSHGCINMPTDKAGQLYNAVEIGTPVYIYN